MKSLARLRRSCSWAFFRRARITIAARRTTPSPIRPSSVRSKGHHSIFPRATLHVTDSCGCPNVTNLCRNLVEARPPSADARQPVYRGSPLTHFDHRHSAGVGLFHHDQRGTHGRQDPSPGWAVRDESRQARPQEVGSYLGTVPGLFDRQGKSLGTAGDPHAYSGVALSPDGTRALSSILCGRELGYKGSTDQLVTSVRG